MSEKEEEANRSDRCQIVIGYISNWLVSYFCRKNY